MAARQTLNHSPLTRERIKTGMLVKRLEQFALGETADGKIVEMTKGQVSAAIALLKKVMPDLQSVQHSGDAQNPIAHRVDLSALSDDQLRALASIKLNDND